MASRTAATRCSYSCGFRQALHFGVGEIEFVGCAPEKCFDPDGTQSGGDEIRCRCIVNEKVFAGEASLSSRIDGDEFEDVISMAVGEGASGAVLFRCRWRAGALGSLAEGSMPIFFGYVGAPPLER